VAQSTQERNKTLVLQVFDLLFNERDYAAAEKHWSPRYIQHSAHIARLQVGVSTSGHADEEGQAMSVDFKKGLRTLHDQEAVKRHPAPVIAPDQPQRPATRLFRGMRPPGVVVSLAVWTLKTG
jgi:hypothetical protein